MPGTHWRGTREERLARLDKQGRRCHGNNRHCTRSAVHRFELIRLDGAGTPIPGEPTVEKQTCAWHRVQFEQSGVYSVRLSERMPTKIVKQPAWRIAERQANADAS